MASTMAKLSAIDGITHVDINYPEHLAGMDAESLKALIRDSGLLVNGVALRFPSLFLGGEFTNRDQALTCEAERICAEAVDLCRMLGGEVVTIWQAFDGFDYPFQVDYATAWMRMREAIGRIADLAAPDIQISIEYKPYQPRSFSLVPNIATALLLAEQAGRPNVGLTLDFCHMLMAGETPAASLALTAAHGRLLGVHLNDGYRLNDDGLMVGSVHLMHTLEFLYYARRAKYRRAIYFDTFPLRENPEMECETNIRTVNRLWAMLDALGMDAIEQMIREQDGMTAMKIQHAVLR